MVASASFVLRENKAPFDFRKQSKQSHHHFGGHVLNIFTKTQYILRYLTVPELRRTVQRQLNKGEYRHKLPRWVFFANQGEFTTGDYEEIMNKASCLSLVSNAILYWNTIKINDIVENLRQQGEEVDNTALSHISLLPYKHILPNGSYFIDDL